MYSSTCMSSDNECRCWPHAELCTARAGEHLLNNLFTTHHALNVPMEVSHVATGFASAETETRCKLENLSRDVSLGAVLGKQLGSQRPGCAPLHSSKRSRSYACCGHCGIAVTAFQHEQLMADGQPAIEAMSCCCTQHSASRPGKPWQRGKRLHVVFFHSTGTRTRFQEATKTRHRHWP